MSIRLDSNFWCRYFKDVFIQQIDAFCDPFVGRVLQAFANMSQEAEEHKDAEYNRLSSQPASEYDTSDMCDIAEQAQGAAIGYYVTLCAIRQTIINLGVAALYHILEQQLLLFHRKHLLYPAEENEIAKISLNVLRKRLQNEGIDIESLQSWPKVTELKLIANSVKHAEGKSAEKVRKLRPDLFTHPDLRALQWTQRPSASRVYSPLAGQDIYLTDNDLETYRSAIIAFWKEFSGVIQDHDNM